MPDPRFVPVDLTMLQDEGVLMAANEAFFWPLGFALTWSYDSDTGQASDLHVRQWEFDDGHLERIDLDPGDPVGAERRGRFQSWRGARHMVDA